MRPRQAIELSQLGSVFALAGSLGDDRSADARFREVASVSTGSLFSPYLKDGLAKTATNGTRIRGSCGVTLIAPSYGVTAAHCVDANSMDLSGLVLEMYRPTGALLDNYAKTTNLTGTFPDYSHGRLAEEDGYFVERFSCSVASRCGDAFGPALACASDISSVADVAVIHCQGRPGDKFAFVELAAADDPSAEVFLPWKHEIYEIPDDPIDDRTLHYTIYSVEVSGNYHYHGANLAGVEQNQLLPLISVPFSDGSKHVKLGSAGGLVTTDLLGCHGTSGAGILQAGPSGWELLGPSVHGNEELTFHLCNHLPSLGAPNGPGLLGLAYDSLDHTLAAVDQLRVAMTNDSSILPPGATSLPIGRALEIAQLGQMPGNQAFAEHLAVPSVRHSPGAAGGKVLALASGESVDLLGFEVLAGQTYRLGLQAWTKQNCAADGCSTLLVAMDGQPVLRQVLQGAGQAPVSLGREIKATADKTTTLTFAVEGGAAVEVGAISLVPSPLTMTFDPWHERGSVVMQDLTMDAPDVRPMRFVGDGRSGFEARLLPKERMLLVRQALVSARSWTLAFAVSGAALLSCGFLDDAGKVVSRVACSDGRAAWTDTALLADSGAHAAILIENESETREALIDDVTISALAMIEPVVESSASDVGVDGVGGDGAIEGGIDSAAQDAGWDDIASDDAGDVYGTWSSDSAADAKNTNPTRPGGGGCQCGILTGRQGRPSVGLAVGLAMACALLLRRRRRS